MSSFLRSVFALFLWLLASAGLALASPARAQTVETPIPVGSNPRAIAVNPITNKIYIASELSNSVIVVDGATNTTTSIPVPARPQYIAVNTTTNKVYVTSGGDSSLTVIDGASGTVAATLPIGSNGPIAVNPVTNRIFIVRLSTAARDETTILDGATNSWFSIALDSFQPDAIAINPVTNKVYVATYATGDVRVVDGSTTTDFPHPPAVPVWSTPIALAVNAATNRTYVVTQDSRGPFGYIDGRTLAYTYFTAPGHASSPTAVAVNPVTNKIYAAFAGEVMVMDGQTNAFSFIPSGTPTAGPIAIGVNTSTNKIYVPNADGTLTVIDGATNAVTTLAIPTGATAIGVDPVTNRMYVTASDSVSVVHGAATDTPQNVPLTTTITPLPGDASDPNSSFTLNATSGFTPTAPPIHAVYFQLDGKAGTWSAASGSGPYTASFSGLSTGSHTLYAFATDTEEATSVNAGPQSVPLVGAISSYSFTVASATLATPTVSVTSSANPSNAGQSVTFTATVSGSAGTPTGTVTFLDGSTAICSSVALSGGAATCATSSLTGGTHSISATYSGDASYNGATSSPLSQTVNATKANASVSLASSANPSNTGQGVTFTATVSGSAGTPTGSATFLDGSATICSSVALSAGTAACATSSLAAGSHAITAQYSGDAGYNGASSGTITQTVQSSTSAAVNVALASNGAMVSASSTNASYNLAAVINGDRTGANITANAWVDDTRDVFPDWVRIDFASAQTIDHVVVYSVQDNYTAPVEPTDTLTFTSFGLTAFDVQGWNGSAWVTLGSVTGNNLVKRTVSFPAATVSAIRVMVNNALLHYSRIVEIEAWSATSAPPPPSSVNVALASNGGVASASSTNASYTLAAVNNGDRTGANLTANVWVDDTRDMFPDSVEIAFPAAHAIDHVVVYSVQDNYTAPVEPTDTMTFSSFGVTAFDVQGWNGSSWVTLGSVTGNNLVKRTVSFPAATVSAIRVMVNNALLHYSRVVEIEAWTASSAAPASGTNFALASNGGVASASSTNASYTLAAVNNGDRTGANLTANVWVDDTRDMFPDSVEIDFPAAHAIDHVVVYSVQDNYTAPVEPTDTMTFSSFGVTAFDVQGWNGSSWVTLGSVTGNNLVKRTVSFPAASISRVRVIVNNALLHYSRIVEIEAWGS